MTARRLMRFTFPAALLAAFVLVPAAAQENERDRAKEPEQAKERERTKQPERAKERERTHQPEQKRERRETTPGQQEKAAGKKSFSGKVQRTKTVDLRGTDYKHLVVLLKNEQGQDVIVDLGLTHHLRDVRVRTGDTISGEGRGVTIGDNKVVMADTVKADGKTVRIDRRMLPPRGERPPRGEQHGQRGQRRPPQRDFSGTVDRTKRVDLPGTDTKHLVVLLETEQGRKIPVDLGPTTGLRDVRVRTGEQISGRGALLSVGDKPVIMAHELKADGRTVQIDRRMPRDRGRGAGEEESAVGRQDRTGRRDMETVRGEVMRTKKVDLKGTDVQHLVVLVETDRGREQICDLGPLRDLRDVRVRSGDRITCEGRTVRIGEREVLMAHHLRADGRSVEIDRMRRPSAERLPTFRGHGPDRGQDRDQLYDPYRAPFRTPIQDRYRDQDRGRP